MNDELADAALPDLTGPDGQDSGTDLLARLLLLRVHKWMLPRRNSGSNYTKGPKQPLWPSTEQVLRGQAVFWRYAPQILASLLHFSLSSGFSSPRVSRILNIASYLVPPMGSIPEGEALRISKESNDRSFMRLMETTQWFIDCMGR